MNYVQRDQEPMTFRNSKQTRDDMHMTQGQYQRSGNRNLEDKKLRTITVSPIENNVEIGQDVLHCEDMIQEN